MNIPVIILGAGGHARVLIDCLLLNKIKILGITSADFINKHAIYGIPILGSDDVILEKKVDKVKLVNGLGSIGNISKRKELYEKFKSLGYSFKSVIHPETIISTFVEIAEGVQIMAGAVIQNGAKIGENTIINTKASIDHDCIIGNHVHIAPGVTLSGGVEVGDGVHIGTGAIIIQGIRIGSNSIIGAGAVVVKDLPENVTAIGIPAKVVYK